MAHFNTEEHHCRTKVCKSSNGRPRESTSTFRSLRGGGRRVRVEGRVLCDFRLQWSLCISAVWCKGCASPRQTTAFCVDVGNGSAPPMLPREALSLSGDVFNLDTTSMLMDMEIVVDPFGEPFQFELLPSPGVVPCSPHSTSAVDGDTSSTGGDDEEGARRGKERRSADDNDEDDHQGAGSGDDGKRGTKRDRKALEIPAEGMQAVLPKHVELELESLDEFDECVWMQWVVCDVRSSDLH